MSVADTMWQQVVDSRPGVRVSNPRTVGGKTLQFQVGRSEQGYEFHITMEVNKWDEYVLRGMRVNLDPDSPEFGTPVFSETYDGVYAEDLKRFIESLYSERWEWDERG